MQFAEPVWLIVIVFALAPWLRAAWRPKMAWPTLEGFSQGAGTWSNRLRALPTIARMAAIGCIAVALARPQEVAGHTRVAGQGVAIVVVLDHSSSMKAQDFDAKAGRVSRLDAAKATLSRFVEGRRDDLIGLVVFANYPFLKSPLTLDHAFLVDTVRDLQTAAPGDDGTNIGNALVWALGALKDASPQKKVIVLLTDGQNKPAVANPYDPEAAARLAQKLGVTVHTIAIGQAGGIIQVPEEATKLPITGEVEGPDVEALRRIAHEGGGRAFVATDVHMLDEVFQTIDQLEKSPVRGTIRTRYRELFGPWVLAAVVLLAFDRLLSGGRMRRLP